MKAIKNIISFRSFVMLGIMLLAMSCTDHSNKVQNVSEDTSGAKLTNTPCKEDVFRLYIFSPKPDKIEQFKTSLATKVKQTKNEEGLDEIFLFEESKEPNKLYLLEHWLNPKAFEAHINLAGSKDFIKGFKNTGGSLETLSLTDQFPELSSFARKRKTPKLVNPNDFFTFLETKSKDVQPLLNVIKPQMMEGQKHHENTLFYVFSIAEKPNVTFLFERWTDETIHQQHFTAAYMNEFIEFATKASIKPPESISLKPIE